MKNQSLSITPAFTEQYSLNKQQSQQLQKCEEYIKKHRIMDLFNELTGKIIITKPEDIREFLVQELINIKSNAKATYFRQKDLEAVFENYNILKLNYATTANLVQALNSVGVTMNEQELVQKYKDLNTNKVEKKRFIEILTSEYYKKFDFST